MSKLNESLHEFLRQPSNDLKTQPSCPGVENVSVNYTLRHITGERPPGVQPTHLSVLLCLSAPLSSNRLEGGLCIYGRLTQ